MKKIITGACIFLVTVMFSTAMAQDGPTKRMDRQRDRVKEQIGRDGDRNGKRVGRNSDRTNTNFDRQSQRGDRRIDRGTDHLRGQRSTRFANPKGHLNWRERQRLDKMQDRAGRHIYRAKHNHVRHRHAVRYNHNVSCYYPVIKTDYADGYEFSVGVSDTDWQFAFSGWNR